MKRPKILIQAFIFYIFSLLFFNSQVFAQTPPNANICTQKQCVKIQNGNLWVLASDNVTYVPYFVKGVGYEPTPIGRYTSDWGYPSNDPRSINNNIYDDPNILNRDFSLLQAMNANTVRIWLANDIKISCQCTNNGRFTNYMTNAGTTTNADTSQNTLDIAASYGLKIIPGFAVGTLTFDANNNIGSIDANGYPLTKQAMINNFVNFVNTFKGNRAILFWAIGNENNFQMNSPMPVVLTTFEIQIGYTNGAAVFNWLQQNGDVDSNGNVIGQVKSSAFQNALQAEFSALGDSNGTDYNLILNDLMTAQGGRLNPLQLTAWYGLVDAMAQAAHAAEGAFFHPVAVVNADVTEIGNSADGAADSQLPDLDIWGANVYYGQSFGALFSHYTAGQSKKPLWISEFGVDAYDTTSTVGINDWGTTAASDQGGSGYYDPADQSTWDGNLWGEILNNSPVTLGGTVMEYSDEWWKPYEFYCTSPNASQAENIMTATLCNSIHKYFGFPEPGAAPDSFFNEEWWGVVGISTNPTAGLPDIVTPRAVYANLQAQWQANPWPLLSLNITGSGAGIMTSTPAFGGGPGINCSFSSTSSSGNCSAVFAKNQPVTLSFSSNNNSTVTDWGVSGCSGNTCTVSPDTNVILNVTVSAPSLPAVALTSPVNGSYFYAGNNEITITAAASSAQGTIKSVSFYAKEAVPNGVTQLLGTVTGSPYSYQWNVLLLGNYYVTAVATDSTGAMNTSAAILISASPTIWSGNLTTDNKSYTAPANIVLSLDNLAVSYNPFGVGPSDSIGHVAFYNGTTWLGTVTRSPYAFLWKSVPAGTYDLTAVATDIHGVPETFSAAPITVNTPSGPTVSITSPKESIKNPVNNVTIKASASSSLGAIKSVAFYASNDNGAPAILLRTVTQRPYTYHWKNIPEGTYYLTAVATDSTGAQATSASVLFFSVRGKSTAIPIIVN